MLLDEDDSIDERLWAEWRNTMTPSVRCTRAPVVPFIDIDLLMSHLTCNMYASWQTWFFFFFFLPMRAKGKIIIIKKTLPSRRCLQRMCWMKEPPCVSLTCVHVSDWPCLGRPTQHHNSHDWVFSHCASQQTTAAHAAASADRLTVMPRWLDRDVVSSFCFFFPPPVFCCCLTFLHFNRTISTETHHNFIIAEIQTRILPKWRVEETNLHTAASFWPHLAGGGC